MRNKNAPEQQAAQEPASPEEIENNPRRYQFEMYTGRAPRPSQPFLTLEGTGRIAVSAGAGRIFGVPEAVELFYDRKSNVIALRPASLKASTSLKVGMHGVASSKGKGGFVVSAIGFCKQFGLHTGVSVRYKVEMYDGMLIANLNTPL